MVVGEVVEVILAANYIAKDGYIDLQKPEALLLQVWMPTISPANCFGFRMPNLIHQQNKLMTQYDFIGIDFGAKNAGTTAICFILDNKLKVIQSKRVVMPICFATIGLKTCHHAIS